VDPDRLEPGEDEAQQHRPVQGAGDDHAVAGSAEREGQRLVAVGRATHGEVADVGPPQHGGPVLGVGEVAVGEGHRVEPAVQRDVAVDDGADQVGALLVPGDGEGRGPLLTEAEPGVEQGSVAAQAPRVIHASPRPAGAR